LQRLDEPVVVVGHQGEGMYMPAICFDRAPQPLLSGSAIPTIQIPVIQENCRRRIAARGHVIERTGKLDP